MSYYDFKPYVSVAKRRAKALREMNKLKKKGVDICPIEIEKRKITKTFWGDKWCNHIESFSDYESRLPRGRTYVRNGSVCHLMMGKGRVEAIVSGSELYNIVIEISPLSNTQWQAIKTHCIGKIGSLIDLLSGKLSEDVMKVVCDHQQGLFPKSKEINLSCDCPDWATMCKHVAAVLYGIGARLDHAPEQLFELRAVDHHELIDTATIDLNAIADSGTSRRRIASDAIADVFDIDLSETPPTKKTKQIITQSSKEKKQSTKPLKKTNTKQQTQLPKYFSGTSLRKKRKQLDLTQNAIAKLIGVSPTTISNWENKGRRKLNLRENVEEALRKLWQ